MSDSKSQSAVDAKVPSAEGTTHATQPVVSTRGTDLTVLSINTTSWLIHKDALLKCADILVVQETRLTSSGQRQNTIDLQSKGFNVLHGAPCQPIVFKKQGRSQVANKASHAGKQGGVAIFSKKVWPLIQCTRDVDITALHKKARWTHAAVPLGQTGALSKRFLHIINFYNLSGRDQGLIRTNRNRYLEKVFAHASRLGQQPVIICMDANTSINNSHCLSTAISSGLWTDLGSFFTNNCPEPTFCASKTWNKISWGKHVTRPDLIFANKAALQICKGFRLRRDLTPKGHLGLEITISVERACLFFSSL